ncbi:MAG TPA: LirA/MavJ family T4SS effector [Terrimicrobiaceae bacterium]
MKKLHGVEEAVLFEFLRENFEPYGAEIDAATKTSDMLLYAKYAIFLSDTAKVKSAANELSEILSRELVEQYKTGIDFDLFLGILAAKFNFSSEVYTFNGQVLPENFAQVVSQKKLFRDLYTRPHGEYTHALQWLLLALVHRPDDVAGVYSRSTSYLSKKEFALRKGSEKLHMWNFLVDCFDGEEDYTANNFARTFRCPQYFTETLREQLPTGPYLGVLLQNLRTKGLKGGPVPAEGESHYGRKGRLKGFIWIPHDTLISLGYEEVTKGVYRRKST